MSDPSSSGTLARRLALEPDGPDRYVADPGPWRSLAPGRPRVPGRLFGGLLAAQALVAAGRSIERGCVHSLHGYFLRPGRRGLPLSFTVERIRDGIGFSARRVVVLQSSEPVFHLAASFAVTSPGIAHQDAMPAAPDPETLSEAGSGSPGRDPADPLEVRYCEPDAGDGAADGRFRVWMRPRAALGADPLLHAAALVYASDGMPLGALARAHALEWRRGLAASLDHAVWLHQPPRFDDWVLYEATSPAAFEGRGLAFGAMYARDGRRLASVAQEGLLRLTGTAAVGGAGGTGTA